MKSLEKKEGRYAEQRKKISNEFMSFDDISGDESTLCRKGDD